MSTEAWIALAALVVTVFMAVTGGLLGAVWWLMWQSIGELRKSVHDMRYELIEVGRQVSVITARNMPLIPPERK